MAKPTSKPDWTVGNPSFGTVTIEPSAGKKETGWTFAERPPFQTMNWLFYNINEWIDYFEDTTDDLVNLQGLYDAVIGPNGDFVSFSDMVADAGWAAGDFKNILVTSDQAISAPITIDQNDVNIDFKPGVSVNKGATSTRGLIVDADRVRISRGRFANFSTAGDAAIEIAASANHVMILESFFLNNDTSILDSGATNVVLSNNIEE